MTERAKKINKLTLLVTKRSSRFTTPSLIFSAKSSSDLVLILVNQSTIKVAVPQIDGVLNSQSDFTGSRLQKNEPRISPVDWSIIQSIHQSIDYSLTGQAKFYEKQFCFRKMTTIISNSQWHSFSQQYTDIPSKCPVQSLVVPIRNRAASRWGFGESFF